MTWGREVAAEVMRAVSEFAGSARDPQGENATVVRQPGPASYDPAASEVAPPTGDDAARVVAGFSPIRDDLVDGQTIRAGDMWAVLAVPRDGLVPRAGDRLDVDAADPHAGRWTILDAQPHGLDGVAVGYRCWVRRGG